MKRVKLKLRVKNKPLDARGFACFMRPRKTGLEMRHTIIIDVDALHEVGLRGEEKHRQALSCLAHEIYHALEYKLGFPVSECRTQKFTDEIENEARAAHKKRRIKR